MIWIKADTEPLTALPSEYKIKDPVALQQALLDNPIPTIELQATYHDGTPMLATITVKAMDVSRWVPRTKMPALHDVVSGTIVELASVINDLPCIDTTFTTHDGRVLWDVHVRLSRVAQVAASSNDTSNDNTSNDTSNDNDAGNANPAPDAVRTTDSTPRPAGPRAQPPAPQTVKAVTPQRSPFRS